MRRHRIDRTASLATAHAEALLEDLLKAGIDPAAREHVVLAGGWRVRVEVSPAPPEELVPGLNACGRAVLRLLWDAEGALSAAKVREALERKGLGVFGLVTVQRALRELHRRHKAVCLSTRRPRGYYLPQRLPLFRVRPAPDDNEVDN